MTRDITVSNNAHFDKGGQLMLFHHQLCIQMNIWTLVSVIIIPTRL